jgi:ABC-type multidrug transport system fused ATPase/permease subunit
VKQFEFPALYKAADGMSNGSQFQFMNLIKLEYVLLFICAMMSLDWSRRAGYFLVYALVLMAALGLAVARNMMKPEQSWYRGRALAESVKTSSWRFCMRAAPFDDRPKVEQSKKEFRDHLLEILRTNRFMGDRLPPDSAADSPVPESMVHARLLDLESRKDYYLEYRIRDQRSWYAKKAAFNKKASRFWFAVGISAYAVAICLAVSRIAYPQWELWPIDAVLVFAAAVLGWTQVKRFNELASSYTLTAHEIGLLQGRLEEVDDEAKFSDFINEAEQAFSREHTQWVARQQS